MSHEATNWAIKQRGLKPTTKIVLWHLCDRFNPDYGCFPSQGRLRPEQEAFRDAVQAQGFSWALVRSLDDALGALADHGFTTRIAPAPRRPAP